MRGYVLKHGTITLDQHLILGQIIDDTGIISLPVWTFLIDHPEGLILIDAGANIYDSPVINPRFWNATHPYYRESWEEGILQRFKELGYKPEDVKYVVVSHLHSDHDGNIHLFPNAQIWVSANEFDGLLRSYGTGCCRPDLVSKIEFWAHYKMNWRLVEEDIVELVPGITLYQYGPGHHFGMLCTQIDFKKYGSVFLAADAIYTAINAGPPMSIPGGAKNREGYIKTQTSIMDHCARNDIELWYGHDMDFFNTKMVKSTEGYYE